MVNAIQLPAVIDNEGAEVVAALQLFLEPQLADRGAAEELVDGIDPVGRLPIASCSQLRFERSARVLSPQITTSTPGVVMEPKAAQKKRLLGRFTSRTRPVGQAEALSIYTCCVRTTDDVRSSR